jgi:nicotinamide-nucleotide amidase
MNNQAELISIGNELLSGRTLNTHAKDLGGVLSAIGLQLVRDTTIPDEISLIGLAVKEALARTDLIFVSGGLGPTVDDITRDALAQTLGQEIILDQATVNVMAGRYAARGREMTPVAERQALVLQGATVLPNSVGAAPGQRIDLPDNQILFALPGPPGEFNAILNQEIVPWLKTRFPDAVPKCVRIVFTAGIGESDIVTLIDKSGFEPNGIDLGFYPGHGKVEIHLTAEPEDEPNVTAAEQSLLLILKNYIEP